MVLWIDLDSRTRRFGNLEHVGRNSLTIRTGVPASRQARESFAHIEPAVEELHDINGYLRSQAVKLIVDGVWLPQTGWREKTACKS
jgi:hypothetical protein